MTKRALSSHATVLMLLVVSTEPAVLGTPGQEVFEPDPRGPQESASVDPGFDDRPCPHDAGSDPNLVDVRPRPVGLPSLRDTALNPVG